ncbi:hypothetical protein [Vibrio sp. 1075]|uniref:hypothetical protein n=1 Tax=Vibrio sp. 1075 TaxID=3074543 RepID=UPI002964A9DF|nr:hypothetical protein [Vibrio sp. 1075]MDW2309498.1 hypothetical protein [Vibrio sp. 1075]
MFWNDYDAILKEAGGAAYLVDFAVFKKNINALNNAFIDNGVNISIGYSYKTNYLPTLCKIAHDEGLLAEVVSGEELEIAIRLGVQGNNIIFNGPVKSDEELHRAFSIGALVNVDSLCEAERVVDIVSRTKLSARIGIRCNLAFPWRNTTSRFGISDENNELNKVFNLLDASEYIEVEGLHCHSSYNRSAESYADRVSKLAELAHQLFKGRPPKFLDIGGGICGPIPEELKGQMSISPPTYNEYAEAIGEALFNYYPKEVAPRLIIEPGVGLVANVMEYICQVKSIKSVLKRKIAVVNGTVQDIKIVPNEINLPIDVIRKQDLEEKANEYESIDISGFTCLEHDNLYYAYQGKLNVDDIVKFSNIGAYSLVVSPNFIKTSPAVVSIDESGSLNLLKRKQKIEEFLNVFYF